MFQLNKNAFKEQFILIRPRITFELDKSVFSRNNVLIKSIIASKSVYKYIFNLNFVLLHSDITFKINEKWGFRTILF
jgi:hypothetical protein